MSGGGQEAKAKVECKVTNMLMDGLGKVTNKLMDGGKRTIGKMRQASSDHLGRTGVPA